MMWAALVLVVVSCAQDTAQSLQESAPPSESAVDDDLAHDAPAQDPMDTPVDGVGLAPQPVDLEQRVDDQISRVEALIEALGKLQPQDTADQDAAQDDADQDDPT